MTHTILYELPLNERIRTFLRLEFLFTQACYSVRGTTVWDSRNTIGHILNILNIMVRIDLRSELVKELERQVSVLKAISSRPGVDPAILEDTLIKLKKYIDKFKAPQRESFDNLRNNNLLKLITQRDAIPGGNCDFDIPVYHFWLTQKPEKRIEILTSWLRQLDNYRLSISIILKLLRESSINTPVTAKQGFYQQSLDTSIAYQLVRVLLPDEVNFYAEMSGGKHRFSVRFMTPLDDDRPVPCTKNIDFQLSCCAL